MMPGAGAAPAGTCESLDMRSIGIVVFALAVMLVQIPTSSAGARAVPVIDLHVDLPYQANYEHEPFARGTGQYPASRLRESHVQGVVLPLYVPRDVSPTGPRLTDLQQSFVSVLSLLQQTPPYALPGCDTTPGKVATWLAFEGAGPLARDPDSVGTWVARGVRVFGLVHSYDNQLATSSGRGSPAPYGLTDAGRQVVRRVAEAGALVDVSHASDAAADEIIAMGLASGRPVIATHSNARALAPHPRNLTDEQIRGIAATGGVVGINFHARFLGRQSATLADVVRHVLHVARIGGVDHVAIGSDFEGGIRPPRALRDIGGFDALGAALQHAGLSHSAVEKVFNGNARRVLCKKLP